MRAGKLDRTITIQRGTNIVNEYGSPAFTWANLATLRAQVVQSSTEEFIENGAEEKTVVIFRTRFLAGVTAADRVHYLGGDFNIRELKEIGRREGLEIRCVRSE